MDTKVEVRGIREVRSALNQVDKELGRKLRDELAKVSEVVLDEARPHVARRTGSAVGSMKVRKQTAGAAIAVGGNKAPYYPWLDFGGRVGRNKSVQREFVKEGRYLYPAIKRKRRVIDDMLDEMLSRLLKQAGFETGGDASK